MKKPLKKYVVVGHLQLAGVTGASSTGQIRVTIPATSQQEAEEKFKGFVLTKAQPVVNSCREAGMFDEVQAIFDQIFRDLP